MVGYVYCLVNVVFGGIIGYWSRYMSILLDLFLKIFICLLCFFEFLGCFYFGVFIEILFLWGGLKSSCVRLVLIVEGFVVLVEV